MKVIEIEGIRLNRDLPKDIPPTLFYGCLVKYVASIGSALSNLPPGNITAEAVLEEVKQKLTTTLPALGRELKENKFLAGYFKEEYQPEKKLSLPNLWTNVRDLTNDGEVDVRLTCPDGSREGVKFQDDVFNQIISLYDRYKEDRWIEVFLKEGHQRAAKLRIPFDDWDDFAQEYAERCRRSRKYWQTFPDDEPDRYRWAIAVNLRKEFSRKQQKIRDNEILTLGDFSLLQTETSEFGIIQSETSNLEKIEIAHFITREQLRHFTTEELKHLSLVLKDTSNKRAAKSLDISISAERARRSRLLKKIRGMRKINEDQ